MVEEARKLRAARKRPTQLLLACSMMVLVLTAFELGQAAPVQIRAGDQRA